jgi:hypothetical protein
MIVWIAVIMYSSGVLEHVLKMTIEESSLSGISERDELIGSELGEHPEAVIQYYDMPTGGRPQLGSVDLKMLHSIETEETKIVSPTSAAEPKKVRGVADRPEVRSYKLEMQIV